MWATSTLLLLLSLALAAATAGGRGQHGEDEANEISQDDVVKTKAKKAPFKSVPVVVKKKKKEDSSSSLLRRAKVSIDLQGRWIEERNKRTGLNDVLYYMGEKKGEASKNVRCTDMLQTSLLFACQAIDGQCSKGETKNSSITILVSPP